MYGDEEMHAQMRKLCIDYIVSFGAIFENTILKSRKVSQVSNRDHYADFITEEFDAYVERKRVPTVNGNHVEMQAMAEMFNRPVHVYEYSDRTFFLPIFA